MRSWREELADKTIKFVLEEGYECFSECSLIAEKDSLPSEKLIVKDLALCSYMRLG